MKTEIQENTIDWAKSALAGARDKIVASRTQTLALIIERIHLLQYAEKNGIPVEYNHLETLIYSKALVHEPENQAIISNILQAQFNVLSQFHHNATPLSEAPAFEGINIANRLQDIDSSLVDESLKIFAISKEVGEAKKILTPSSASYIVPSREAVVFQPIFDTLKKDFDFTKDGDAYITQWYRHSIALSLKAQQPIVIYTIEGDEAAKETAKHYLPGSEILEVSNLMFLLQEVQNNPEHVGFFNKAIAGRGQLAHAELQRNENNVTAFTPFPDYSPNLHVDSNVVAIAQLAHEAKIENDKPLVSASQFKAITIR